MSRFLPPTWLVEVLFLWASAAAVAIALDMGAGFDLGWWGFLFWAGIGGLMAWVKAS